MLKIIAKTSWVLKFLVVLGMLVVMPLNVNAGRHDRHKPGGHHQWGGGHHHSVPELTLNGASGALVLLIGGSLVFFGRRHRKPKK